MAPTTLEIRPLAAYDEQPLCRYFNNLSDLTRSRFGPHPFDPQTVNALCNQRFEQLLARVAVIPEEGRIVAYLVVKPGYLHFEEERYRSYGLQLDHQRDYTLAPSVADDHQSTGVGSRLMAQVLAELHQRGGGKVVLWGGVQATNTRACNFYRKFGFQQLGSFEHNGLNYDMVLMLASPS